MLDNKTQRKYPRIYLKVEVRSKTEDSDILLGHSRDISKEGIFIETHKNFSPNSEIPLIFKLPYESEVVEIKGKVVWMKSIEGTGDISSRQTTVPRWVRPGIGVHFEDIDAKNRLLLDGFLDDRYRLDSDNYTLADFIELPDKDIFAKTIPCLEFVEDYGRKGYQTYRRPLLSSCSRRVVILDPQTGKKKEMIMMASNNYLGLTTHPKVVKAGLSALKKYGAGSGGVPQLSGTFDLTRRLEEKLARWKGCEDAIVFPAGYSSSIGTISALVKKDDAVIIDHFAHASLMDGCMMSKGHVEVFKHNDISELENILQKCDHNWAGKLIVVDSVYSMDGDIAPLPDIKRLAESYGARVMVDEAHASGVIGKEGRGITDYFNMPGEVDIIAGTLSKALGGVGGFAASSRQVVDYMRYYAHSYFFSTSIPPSVMASVLAAIEVIEKEPSLRRRLWNNIKYMKGHLKALGFNIGNSESAIIPILIGDEMILRKMSKRIHELGIYLNPVPYPAVPHDKCRFRLTLMATHTKADLDETLDVLEKAGKEFGVISSSAPHLNPLPGGEREGRQRRASPTAGRGGNLSMTDKPLTLKVLKTITEISQEEWDSIVGEDRIICSYNYLRAVEESHINDCDYRYLLVYANDRLIAHTCIYSMSFELDVLARGVTKKITMAIRKIFPNFLRLKLVECGTPVALGNTISFAEGASETVIARSPEASGRRSNLKDGIASPQQIGARNDNKAALSLIINGMENFAKTKGIGLTLLRDFTDKETPFFNCLKGNGYVRLSNLPNAVMECKWESFEDYIEGLRSHYRLKIKKQIKKAEDNGVSVEVKNDYGNIALWLLRLWKNTYEKAKEYRREILTEDFFRNMSLYLRDKAEIILLRKEAQILGYALVLKDEHSLRFMFTGIDYEFNERYSVYFNCLYNIVKLAINEGKRKIDLGITTLSSKTDLGAYVEPLFIYMKHKYFLSNFLITSLFKFVSSYKGDALKRVFKENLDKG